MIESMDSDMNNSLINRFMRDISLMAYLKESVNLHGRIRKRMMAIGLMDSSMVRVYGLVFREINIWVSGNVVRLMDMVYIFG